MNLHYSGYIIQFSCAFLAGGWGEGGLQRWATPPGKYSLQFGMCVCESADVYLQISHEFAVCLRNMTWPGPDTAHMFISATPS